MMKNSHSKISTSRTPEMSSTLEHFSHPKHLLTLKEHEPFGLDVACDKLVVGSPTTSCSSEDIDWERLYLSKSCTELPTLINYDNTLLTLSHEDNQEQPHAMFHDSHQEHKLIRMQTKSLFKCDACWEEAEDFSYICTICNFQIHTTCAFSPSIIRAPYHHHPLNLIYSIPDMYRIFTQYCRLCHERVNPIHWLYYCHRCIFFVHLKCAGSFHIAEDCTDYDITEDTKCARSFHIAEDFTDYDITEDTKCCGCNKPVIGCPTYTCTSKHDIGCKRFYLHKNCAELPQQIIHHKHDQHPLTLLLPRHPCICKACGRKWKFFTYTCDDCQFDVCVLCAFEQRKLDHEGHKHTLTLMKRKAFFSCDACGEEAKDSSYACTTCEFWIHKKCALLPLNIPAPSYHLDHPLKLIYSIPKMHRNFPRVCDICQNPVDINFWLYYCHACTYFVHMKCVSASILNVIEEDCGDHESDLVQFPLPSEESLLDLIVAECGKLQVDFKGEGENSVITSTVTNDPHIYEEHWSHMNHPLEMLQFSANEDEDNSTDDDRRVLICDGCVQPITVFHPSYYACIHCGFFLHSFCATKLPLQLPTGASSFHPQHLLSLQKGKSFYSLVKCGVCSQATNGFYYLCEICDVKIDIRCAFLPTKIKHKSHKHHSLVQRPFSNSVCSVSKLWISSGMEYACENCSKFQIHINCTLYPSRMKHRYDLHPITLKLPPFFYEGVFYCEICEEQVNNQWWLYHCSESDHSFHYDCLRWYESVKFGGTIKLDIDNEPHTLAMVVKRTTRRKNCILYICKNCGDGYEIGLFFECDGCGYLICHRCVIKILDK